MWLLCATLGKSPLGFGVLRTMKASVAPGLGLVLLRPACLQGHLPWGPMTSAQSLGLPVPGRVSS